MDQNQTARRTCPACGSGDYAFRGRKKIPPGPGKEEATETKYRCKGCAHEWKICVAVKTAR
jgi:hypothetical protein